MWSSVKNLLVSQQLNVSCHLKSSVLKVSHHASNNLISYTACRSLSTVNFGNFSTTLLQPWRKNSLLTRSEDMTSPSPYEVTAFVPSRGIKLKGRVNRRCKDCQLVWKDGVLFNECKTFPRHKQMLKQQYWENKRILTHATQGPIRPW